MPSYVIGQYVGGLIITYLLTRVVRKVVKKHTKEKTTSVATFLVSSLIILAITSLTMGVSQATAIYLPCLLLWFVIDMLRSKKEPHTPQTGLRDDAVARRERADVMR